ncbi:Uncharacterised protein r2_g1709 [Pycnogonum litorale]
MSMHIKNLFARKVNEKDDEHDVWYIHHHPVINVNKPNKVRIVFDCSAKHESVSLNDMLYQGPDLANELIGVLIRFRTFKFAMMADVDTMYYQVQVVPQDRKMLRFFWFPDGDLEQHPVEYEMLVHLFGATSSPSCAVFALKQTANDNTDIFDSSITNVVHRSFYIDDCLQSVDSIDEAKRIFRDLCDLLKRGGFRLTKWISNSQLLNDHFPVNERSEKLSKSMNLDQFLCERVLGVKWDVKRDEFFFDIKAKKKPLTKRGIMSVISSIYDPLGFLAPSTLKGKLIMQSSFRQTKGWDEPLEETVVSAWSRWLDSSSGLSQLKVTRWLQNAVSTNVVSRQVIVFSDASELGYCAVAYLRTVSNEGKVFCSFVMGKCRLTPLKSVTIPRLELSAAVLAVQLGNKICQELEMHMNDVLYYTDSTAVMQYIRSEARRFKTFVANRVTKIHEGSTTSQWRHIPGKENPADDATRCQQSDRWLNGPEFLWNCDFSDSHPVSKLNEVSEDDVEVKRRVFAFLTTCDDFLSRLIERHSNWFKLKKSVAWLTRFRNFVVSKTKNIQVQTGDLKVEEIQEAERSILQRVQESINEHSVRRLNSIYIDKLMKVGGRLSNARLNASSKNPIILPKDHSVTNSIIEWYHRMYGHVGREHVLSLIRQKFWILHARSAIRKVLSKCVQCRKLNASPNRQIMANLPPDRLEYGNAPFTNVGVDCFGPFLVTVKRSKVKRYGCLFTCLNTRAVHIEVLFSMEADSFIQALKRFISRRGTPSLIRSDQGTNFKGAQRELLEFSDMVQSKVITELSKEREIKWIFNCPSAPHMGGVWERMIRTTKRILTNLLRTENFNDETLITVLAETETIINSRPITASSDDPNDFEALTPNHLLILRSGHPFPPNDISIEQTYKRGWKHAHHLSNVFWKRWVREYMPELQERKKWYKESLNLKEGDLVLIVYEKTTRGKWPLGRIVTVFEGSDKLVQSALVKTSKSQIVRPIHKLCKIF